MLWLGHCEKVVLDKIPCMHADVERPRLSVRSDLNDVNIFYGGLLGGIASPS